MLIFYKMYNSRNRSIDRGRWPISSDGKLLENILASDSKGSADGVGQKTSAKAVELRGGSESAPSRLRGFKTGGLREKHARMLMLS